MPRGDSSEAHQEQPERLEEARKDCMNANRKFADCGLLCIHSEGRGRARKEECISNARARELGTQRAGLIGMLLPF